MISVPVPGADQGEGRAELFSGKHFSGLTRFSSLLVSSNQNIQPGADQGEGRAESASIGQATETGRAGGAGRARLREYIVRRVHARIGLCYALWA